MTLPDNIHKGNVTLVAMYGEKPDAVKDVISNIQRILVAILDTSFEPYSMDQIHSTIIGLEGVLSDNSGQLINKNYLERRREARRMDLAVAAQMLTEVRLHVRIGGYRSDQYYEFTSRGSHPYVRSFSFEQGQAVMIGWAEGSELDRVRRAFQDANILHKYHVDSSSRDNDLYMVIGRTADASVVDQALLAVRTYLAAHTTWLTIGPEHLSVVTYRDSALPPSDCVALPVPLCEDQLRSLYQA